MIKMQIIVLKFALFDVHFYDQFVIKANQSPITWIMLLHGRPLF